MTDLLALAKRYEAALFAGRMDEVGVLLTDDVVYWIAGRAPLGGTWRGRTAVLRAFDGREFGLGAGDWGSEDLAREWMACGDRVIVEIHERSWLKSAPDDVMDQRTCVVLRFSGERICEMRDYTDSAIYEAFVARHCAELPKFAPDVAARA